MFPPPKPRIAGEPAADAELAPLLDFVARRAASPTSDGAGPTDADTMLNLLLWELGTDQSRSMLESALALIAPVEGDTVAPEIAAMRAWLARHPR
ncbi:MAG: hypothetical protein IAG13_28655 [Deltaproteobacteria bacterium]|nr:hypothetical protein [Nannocystaceae bacterium]